MKQQPTMECPSCKEIEFHHIKTSGELLEYCCKVCNNYATFKAPLPDTDTIAVAWTYVPVHLRNQAE